MPNDVDTLRGLKVELAGYETTGNADRARQVREQIEKLGGVVETADAKTDVERRPAPKKKTTTRKG